MRLHILGIAGTFMAGIALIAREMGHDVTGSDQAIYPPMSHVLADAGITVLEGYDNQSLPENVDLVIIGNALSRGNAMVEAVLESDTPFVSGAQWLYQEVLHKKWVIALSGTHGKTTTSSMVTWILEHADENPSYLIGGKPGNLPASARLTDSPYFVIEADEYDTAFFDKRSKFVHYHPKTLIINNLEFDHADIFNSIEDIQRQFHHLVRLIPASGKIIYPLDSSTISETLNKGCWSQTETLAVNEPNAQADWSMQLLANDFSAFSVLHHGEVVAEVNWQLWGKHNAQNAIAAIAACHHVGIAPEKAAAALNEFISSARRLDLLATIDDVPIYEDFAHHPTAIATTLQAVKAHHQGKRLVCALEPRSYTMRNGVHEDTLPNALAVADKVMLLQPSNSEWNLQSVLHKLGAAGALAWSVEELLQQLVNEIQPGDVVVLMSNGSFGGLQQMLPAALAARDERVV